MLTTNTCICWWCRDYGFLARRAKHEGKPHDALHIKLCTTDDPTQTCTIGIPTYEVDDRHWRSMQIMPALTDVELRDALQVRDTPSIQSVAARMHALVSLATACVPACLLLRPCSCMGTMQR